MQRGELTGFDLESIAPVAAFQPLEHIPENSQTPRLPLPEHMEVFVQHQVRIAPELLGGASQENSVAARRCAGASVQACVEGLLNYANMRRLLSKNFTQRLQHFMRGRT